MIFLGSTWQRLGVVCLALLLLVIAGGAVAFAVISTPSFQTEQEWFETQAKYLSKVRFTPQMIAGAKPWRRDGDRWEYYVIAREGFIPIGTENGVYVVVHSFHDNELRGFKRAVLRFQVRAGINRGEPRVSDAVLAVDQQGNLYKCGGHICGCLFLGSNKEVLTLEDFLETTNMNVGGKWEAYASVH